MILLYGLSLVGCRKRVSVDVPEIVTERAEPSEVPSETAGEPAGPGGWRGHGLELYVPLGWRGRQGGASWLDITHEETGVRLTLQSAQRLDAALEGCRFVDDTQHDGLSGLGPAHTATCMDERFVRDVWWPVDGPGVVVEVWYPEGQIIRGRLEIKPVLDDLRAF